jgi:hypothetical protein
MDTKSAIAKTQPRALRSSVRSFARQRGFLVGILVVLCVLEFRAINYDVRDIHQSGEFPVRYSNGRVVREVEQISVSDIAPWMTFAYVNFVFKLPSSYLQAILGVQDGRYPNIQIGGFARRSGQPSAAVTATIQNAVRRFQFAQ